MELADNAPARVVVPDTVNEEAEITPEIVKVVIYDNTGNVVYSGKKAEWNLTNSSGRNVANGAYLVIVEAKGRSGKVYWYSAKIGVRR